MSSRICRCVFGWVIPLVSQVHSPFIFMAKQSKNSGKGRTVRVKQIWLIRDTGRPERVSASRGDGERGLCSSIGQVSNITHAHLLCHSLSFSFTKAYFSCVTILHDSLTLQTKAPCSFEMPRTTRPMTQHHIPEASSLQQHCSCLLSLEQSLILNLNF